MKAVYPGTFDPITNGHVDIIKRASAIFDEVVVAVVKKPSKNTLLSFRQRLELTKDAAKGIKNVKVEGFSGLVVNFAVKTGAGVIVRGLRMISDFEYEFQMALTNRSLSPKVETVFLMPHPKYSYVSSRLIKEVAYLGADLGDFLSSRVLKALRDKIK